MLVLKQKKYLLVEEEKEVDNSVLEKKTFSSFSLSYSMVK